MRLPGTPIQRVAAVIVAFGCLLSSPARADTTIALGNGVELVYRSGSLDPISLEGSAKLVRLFIDDKLVVLVDSLKLATRGTLVDPDFSITELEAQGISSGRTSIGEVHGRDLIVGAPGSFLRALNPRPKPVKTIFPALPGGISIRELTLEGIQHFVGDNEIFSDRLRLQSLADGRAAAMEVDGGRIGAWNADGRIRIGSARIEGFSFGDNTYDGYTATDVSIARETLELAVGAMESQIESAYLPDGTPYALWSYLSFDNLAATPASGQPAAEADRGTDFWNQIGGLKVVLNTSTRPDGDNFIAAYQVELIEEAGDAVVLSARFQVPIISWQTIGDALETAPLTAFQRILPLATSGMLVNGAIELKGRALADQAAPASAEGRSEDGKDPQSTIAQAAAGLLTALPGSDSLRDAISTFLAKSGNLRIVASPVHPIPIALLLGNDSVPTGVWEKLNIRATHSLP